MNRPWLIPVLSFVLAAIVSDSICRAETVIEFAQQRVVKIYGTGGIRNLHAYSTGFLVSPKGHVATIWNHVLDQDVVTVVLDDGRRFQASLVNAEPQLDLAVLKIDSEETGFPYFDPADAGHADPGARVLAFSNVFRVATGNESVSVMHGVIAAHTQLAARRGAFQLPYEGSVYVIDSVTNSSGAGGGVITSHDGILLGMLGRELRNARSNTWVNFAIPVTELRPVIEQIIAGRFTARRRQARDTHETPACTPLDFGLILVPDVVTRTPAYVVGVVSGSAAALNGVQRDDLILFANDELIQSQRQLRSVLGAFEAPGTLKVVMRRGDQLVSIELSVERKPDAD